VYIEYFTACGKEYPKNVAVRKLQENRKNKGHEEQHLFQEFQSLTEYEV